ncbi:hypothetical protein HDU82_007188, partial [Entophlyctis luteolus]
MAFQQCTGGTFISKFDILPRDKLLTRELEDPGQIVFAYPGVNSVQIVDGESYFGFIDDEVDALIVIEATIIALLKPFPGTAAALTNLRVRSGSVFVIPESSQFARRWVDGLQWSPSRAYGSFLLYRQIEKVNEHKTGVESRSNEGGRAISGVAPTFSKKSLKAGTQIIMDERFRWDREQSFVPKEKRRPRPVKPDLLSPKASKSGMNEMEREEYNAAAMESFLEKARAECPNCARKFEQTRLEIHLRYIRSFTILLTLEIKNSRYRSCKPGGFFARKSEKRQIDTSSPALPEKMAVDAPTDTLALALAHARNDERRAVAVGVYGTRVCYMQLIDLFVVACGGDGNLAVSHQVTHNPPDTVLRACGWTYHPDILWYEAGKAGHEGTTVYAVNVATGSTVCLSAEAPSGSTNRVVGVSPEYPAHVLVSCDAQVLYLSHVKTGHSAVQLAPETDVDSRFALTSFVADRALAAVVATKVNDKGDLEATLFNLGVSIAQNNRSSISFNPQRASIGAAPAATTAAVTGHESFGAKTRKSVKSLMSKTTLIRSRFSRNRQPSAAPAPMLPSTSEVPSPGDPDTPQGKRVVGVAASAAGTIHSFSQDSSSVLVSIHDPYAGHVLLSINFATLQTTEVLRTTDRITRVLASPSTGRLWACQTQSARSTRQHYTAIDSAVSSDFARLDQFTRSFSSSADWVLHSISGDPDSRTWVISVETQSSRKYYLHKRGSGRDPAFLFNAWPAMDTLMPGDSLSRTRRVGLLSRDA